jgi:hypothetical protein
MSGNRAAWVAFGGLLDLGIDKPWRGIFHSICHTAGGDFGLVVCPISNLGMAVLVSVVHSVAMIAAGGFLAWLVYRYLGLKFVSRSWFNLDATWAFSFVFVGALSLAISIASRH